MDKKAINNSNIISLPSGSPQIDGISEKFRVDLYSGTGNFSLPIDIPTGIDGLQPDVVLQYSTAAGSTEFGFGWNISNMSIFRSTSEGIPSYHNNNDVFIFSGEELVRVEDNKFRMRTESSFSTFEKHGGGWTMTTQDRTKYQFGLTSNSRLFDDSNENNIFSWFLESITDPNGNNIKYTYFRDMNMIFLSSIRYGPYEISFEYEERPDQYTNYRSGFPVSTRLRCIEIQLTSDLSPVHQIRKYSLIYDNNEYSKISLLSKIMLTGKPEQNHVVMPPITFTYNRFIIDKFGYKQFDSKMNYLPPSLSSRTVELVDLEGFGLPGILDTSSVQPMYWQNPGNYQWSHPRIIKKFPAVNAFSDYKGLFLADLEGNGTLDIVYYDNGMRGYFPNKSNSTFEDIIYYKSVIPFNPINPDFRFLDIDGDRRIDGIYSSSSSFLLYQNLGREGWDNKVNIIRRIHDLSEWPDISFSNPQVSLEDMNGDGLVDIVLTKSGEIRYWPYKGNGQWDKSVVMNNSPILKRNYDYSRIFFVDIDRNGLTDLLYVDFHEIVFWLNIDGRSFSEEFKVGPIPPTNANVVIADMLGEGKPGILLSYDLNNEYRYFSFVENAPYLLNSIDNGLGALTKIEYESSVHFEKMDNDEGISWNTFLPFPLQVVSSVEIHDKLTETKLKTEYHYHDGHYDGLKREFRGFGKVDEIEYGDESTPTILREHTFHLGIDDERTEAERRELTLFLRNKLRSLKGNTKHVRVSVADFNGNGQQHNKLVEEIFNKWAIREEQIEQEGVFFPHLEESMHIYYDETDAKTNSLNINRILGHDTSGKVLGQEIMGGHRLENGEIQIELYRREEYKYCRNIESNDFTSSLCRTLVYNDLNNIISVTNYYYDGNAFVGLPFERVDRGNLTRIEELVFSDNTEIADNIGLNELGYFHLDPDTNNGILVSGWYRNRISYEYNFNGTLRKIKDSLGHESQIFYDDVGIHPIEVIDAANLVTRAYYDYSVDEIQSVINPSGLITQHEYDGIGRIKKIFRSDDEGNLYLSKQIFYDHGNFVSENLMPPSILTVIPRSKLLAGNLPEMIINDLDDIESLTDYNIQRIFYSGTGLEIQKIGSAERSEETNTPQTIMRSNIWYNNRGQICELGFPEFRNSFNFHPINTDRPGVGTYRYFYDYDNRLIKYVRPDNAVQKKVYSPRKVNYINENDEKAGKSTGSIVEKFDSFGRLIIVEEYLSEGHKLITHFKYDEMNRLLGVVDSRNIQILQNNYDNVGRKISSAHVDAGTRNYIYDSCNNLIELHFDNNRSVKYQYDKLNRLVAAYADTIQPDSLISSYVYDSDPQFPNRPYVKGRLVMVKDKTVTTRYEYNAVGQRVNKRREFTNGNIFELTAKYDILGNLIEMTYPEGTVINLQYNEANLLKGISHIIDDIRYNHFGQTTKVAFSNGIVSNYYYNRNNLLERYEVFSPENQLLSKILYQYDLVGNLRLVNDSNTENTIEYKYDDLHRIVEKNVLNSSISIDSYTYRYDQVGNLLENSETIHGHLRYLNTNRPDLLTEYEKKVDDNTITSISLNYDSRGNVIGKESTKFEYDIFNRLTRISKPNQEVVNLEYDSQDTRVRKEAINNDNQIEETFYFDDIFESKNSQSILHIGSIAAIKKDGDSNRTMTFFNTDHLGSILIATDEVGRIKYRRDYSSFGFDRKLESGMKGFLGRTFDADLNTYMFGKRLYDPQIGRFLNPDDTIVESTENFLSNPQSLNIYSYGYNNPLRFVDPGGRYGLIAAAIIGAIIGAVIGGMAANEIAGKEAIAMGIIAGGLIGLFGGYFGMLGAAIKGAAISVGLKGAQNAIFGTSGGYWSAAAIGFTFGIVGKVSSWIPAVTTQKVSNVANVALELVVDTSVSGIRGGITSSSNGEGFMKGFSSGLVFGAISSSAKIAVLGIKYDPFTKVSKQDFIQRYNIENGLDRSFISKEVANIGTKELYRATWRRYGLAIRISDVTVGNKGFVVGSNVLMSAPDAYDIETLPHEFRHVMQQRVLEFGSAEFYMRWIHQKRTGHLSFGGHLFYYNDITNTTFETPSAGTPYGMWG